MSDNILFYLIFSSQVFLVSYYYPKKYLSRIRYVFDAYPPSKYPKLYPNAIEIEEKRHRLYWNINKGIFALGIILLFVHGLLSSDVSTKYKQAEGLPIFFGMLQFLPLILIDLSRLKQLKLMRKMDLRTTRKAKLQPRRLFDFISPTFIAVVILFNVLYWVVEFLMPGFLFHWDSDAVIRVCSLLACNLLFVGIIIWNLSGKKLDPYQDYDDRIRQIGFTVKSLASTSIAGSVFFVLQIVFDDFDLGYLEILANSLYFQVIAVLSFGAMLRSFKVDKINFDVYK
ncbi:hypothetical protein JYU12_01050 [bacterium AH-315-K03]|nr:hypothetical protein [bacterium AH-315-K03]